MLEAAVLRLRGARVEFHKVVNQKDHHPLLHCLGKSAIAANVARLKTELIFADAKAQKRTTCENLTETTFSKMICKHKRYQ